MVGKINAVIIVILIMFAFVLEGLQILGSGFAGYKGVLKGYDGIMKGYGSVLKGYEGD
jgi:hypothetical protein